MTEFVAVAEEVEQQFNHQFEEYKHSFYDEVLIEIAHRRDEVTVVQAQTSAFRAPPHMQDRIEQPANRNLSGGELIDEFDHQLEKRLLHCAQWKAYNIM